VGAAVLTTIAAPIADSLIKEKKWPDSVADVIGTLWSWLTALAEWFTQTIILPLWILLAGFGLLFAAIIILYRSKMKFSSQLESALAKLNPKLPVLDESQQKVLAVIVAVEERGDYMNTSRLHTATGLSRIVCQRAVDVLMGYDLICDNSVVAEDYVFLTEMGREYVLHPQKPLLWEARPN
jgi:hypothetical protein